MQDHVTKKWLMETHPNIQLTENLVPRGFGSNVNKIIKENPNFDYFLLMNPDVICLPGMIEQLLSAMEKDRQIGAAGPKLLNFDGSIQPSRRRFATFSVLIVRALHLDKIFKNLTVINNYMMNDYKFDHINEVDWITGAVMILRKATLDQVGLLDERFFLYFEDEDLCCRIWRHGWKVCYISSAEAYHAHIAEGRNKILSKANFHHILSAFKFFIKYRGKISRC